MTRTLWGEDLVRANEIIYPGSSITNDAHEKAATFSYINKGALHLFRKMSTNMLHPSDCHYLLRKQKLEELGEQAQQITQQVNISIAWDNCCMWENCGQDAVRVTFDYLKETMLSKTFQDICKNKGSLVSPKTSIHMLCQFLINEYNEFTNIEDPQKSTTMDKLCALIPIDISLLEDDLNFFNQEEYRLKNIRVDELSDENDELNGNTMKSCELCCGEIFNVYLKKKKGRNGSPFVLGVLAD